MRTQIGLKMSKCGSFMWMTSLLPSGLGVPPLGVKPCTLTTVTQHIAPESVAIGALLNVVVDQLKTTNHIFTPCPYFI